MKNTDPQQEITRVIQTQTSLDSFTYYVFQGEKDIYWKRKPGSREKKKSKGGREVKKSNSNSHKGQ